MGSLCPSGPVTHTLTNFEARSRPRVVNGLSGRHALQKIDLWNSTAHLHPSVPAPEVASRAGDLAEVFWRIYARRIYGHQPPWNQRVRKPSPTAKTERTGGPMIIRIAPDLFRHCSVNSRQKRGAAGKHRQRTTTARGRVSTGQGPFALVVAGVGFEPT
jgi:hypothetical protein